MKTLLTLLLLVTLPVSGDVIHMKNGDRITGEITEMQGNEVTIEPAYSDKFTVDMDDIESISTEKKFEVELSDGQEGKFQFGGVDDEGKVILSAEHDVTDTFAEEKSVKELEAWYQWDSKVDLNQSFSRGNTNSASSNLNANLEMKWGDHRSINTLTNTREELDGKNTKELDRLNMSYNWLFSDPWFLAVNITAERNPIALLDRRTSINPALGYDIWDDPNLSLNIQLGAGYQTEVIDNATETSSLVDWRLRYEQDILSGDLELFHYHQIYRNFGGRENVIFNSQSGVRYEITDDMYLNVQINYDVDSEPAEGADGEDLTFLLGAGIEF